MKEFLGGALMGTVFALILFYSIPGKAVEMEISIGQSQYTKADNGTWWQNGFYNDFQLKSNSIGLGITDYLTDSIKYHAGYMNLGNVSSSAEAVALDANYNGVNGCNDPCLPLSHWNGKGKVEGIYFTLAPEVKYHYMTFFIEAGGWLYKPEFSIVVPDTHYSQTGNTVYWAHKSGDDVYLGAVFGYGVRYKNTELVARWFRVDAQGSDEKKIAIYQGYTSDISLRVNF